MPHIHTEDNQHDHTTSAFIVRTDFSEPKLMVHMHRKIGKLLQAGGHVELDETPWQSIRHELIEETGYDLNQLRILQPASNRLDFLSTAVVHPIPVVTHTHAYSSQSTHKHTDTVYAFIASGEPKGLPAEGESQDVRWLTLSELKAYDPDGISKITVEIGEHILTCLLQEWVTLDLDYFQG